MRQSVLQQARLRGLVEVICPNQAVVTVLSNHREYRHLDRSRCLAEGLARGQPASDLHLVPGRENCFIRFASDRH